MKRTGWIVAVVVAAVITFFGFRGPSDRELIDQAITESTRAGREGRPGGVLEYLSKSLKVNQIEYSGSRFDISRFVRESRPDVQLDNRVVEVDEAAGTAIVTASAKVSASIFGMGEISREIDKVRVHLERQDSRKWLLFPAKIWRIVSVDAPNVDIPSLFSQ
ncbi:MAG: hypothetical protein HONBIEJF_00894 [Fimbriimonadaceae bacterium]|nr:hypothetical protein [Fimbriimonadaceae bacterium]